jgi:microcystin-dependent protein
MKNIYKFAIALVLISIFILILNQSIFSANKTPEPFNPPTILQSFDQPKILESFDPVDPNPNRILLINDSLNLSSFKTTTNSLLLVDGSGQLKNLSLPIGMVIPWTGTGALPIGWSECDGITYNNVKTPNLINRFILSKSASRDIGVTGGEETVTLKSENVPKHTHNFQVATYSTRIHGGGCGGDKYNISGSSSQPSTSTGGGQAHNNMPPFYVLRYICYTGIQATNTGTPSGKNIVTVDDNGNSSLCKTSNNSLLMTDMSGNVNNLSFLPGMIMMWQDSANIPSGWAMCDGTLINGFQTPDLKFRFVLGKSASKTIGTIGGEEKVKLTTAQIPAHSHNLEQNNIGSNCFRDSSYCFSDNGEYVVYNSRNTQVVSNNGTGGDTSHNNMPPYYVLCYICYVGIVGDPGTPSQNKIMLTNNFGELSTYVIKKDSLLLTDGSGIIKSLSFKKGIITAWYNFGITGLPSGWSLCDGNKYPAIDGYQTPDLRGKFILGYDKDKEVIGPSDKGQEQVTLQLTNVPYHNHNISLLDYGGSCFAYGSGANNQLTRQTANSDGSNLSKADGTVAPHENMPPYFVLCYICYTGDNL